VGDRFEVTVGAVAHGGHCVARHDGQVVFVRHSLPGERVVVEVTGVGPKGRFLRADAVDVLLPSPDRVVPACPYAGPGGCGGCDWQHATVAAQRRLKSMVVGEQLHRLGGLDRSVVVEQVAGDEDGTRWRTRVRFAVDRDGQAGLRRHRSHDVVPVSDCLIAHPGIDASAVLAQRWPGAEWVEVSTSASTAESDLRVYPGSVGGALHHRAAGRTWRVSGGGFWQVHPGAADVLASCVASMLQPGSAEHVVDLYCGVGLFAGALAPALGPGGRVDAVEGHPTAAADATENLSDLAVVSVHAEPVEGFLARGRLRRCDLVVLDPPRAGAGAAVVEAVAGLRPRAVAYVACDPAALGRDVRTFAAAGYSLSEVRGFDVFPMTHHVECVALLERDSDSILISR
jgi:tRNA/tmRNA/rRNA uracil-C5-methylase (TrmA/RlmC/RlmD family)